MNGVAVHLARGTGFDEASRRANVAFGATAVSCLGAFGWLITLGTFRFIAADEFGSFYDHQAAAWLKGRWDVPEPALSEESFVVDGKVYGYFGPTPALIRVPLVALGVGFGQVTRLCMMLDFAACLAGAYALLRLARRWHESSAVPSVVMTILFTATVGLGSTLFFLGSRAYVYHEAILCGAACAIWSAYATLRYFRAPASRWWLPALGLGVLAVQARAPSGLFALTLLGCAALAVLITKRHSPAAATLRRHIGIGATSVAGVLSFNAVSYLKFGTFEGCPLRYNVHYTAEKLAVVEGRNFHLSNLRFNSDAYLLRPSLSLSRHFPYIYREFADRRLYPESRMVYRDQTLAMPWAMPGLFALAVAGSALAAAILPAARTPLIVLWAAAIPFTLAMLTAIAVTQRYTADFSPFLIAVAAFGIAGIETLRPRLRAMTGMIAASPCILGILITAALAVHHQREIVWGVPEEARCEYERFRREVDAFLGVAPSVSEQPRPAATPRDPLQGT